MKRIGTKRPWMPAPCELDYHPKPSSDWPRLPDLDVLEDGDATEIGAKGVRRSFYSRRFT